MPAHLIALFVASGLAVGQYVPGGTFNASMYTDQPGAVIGDGYGDQLYPYDSPAPWQHGYIQSIPAYGGFNYFRPYNYRHVLSQTRVDGEWFRRWGTRSSSGIGMRIRQLSSSRSGISPDNIQRPDRWICLLSHRTEASRGAVMGLRLTAVYRAVSPNMEHRPTAVPDRAVEIGLADDSHVRSHTMAADCQ